MKTLIVFFCLVLAGVASAEWRTCERVVDGDTIILDGGERVRLIGINTPEIFLRKNTPALKGRFAAAAWLVERIEGQRIRVETPFNHKDNYNRTLAYVFDEHGTMMNLLMLQEGIATLETRFNHPRLQEWTSLFSH